MIFWQAALLVRAVIVDVVRRRATQPDAVRRTVPQSDKGPGGRV